MVRNAIPAQTALLIVDMQRDFMDGGAVPVPGAKDIVPEINHYVATFGNALAPVLLSRDWHPPDHCSFYAQGGRWPPHCIAGTEGSEFVRKLVIPDSAIIVSKGSEAAHEAYSAFDGTALARILYRRSIRSLWIGGVALEYCVRASTLDAIRAGFEVYLLIDALRAVDAQRGDGDRTLDELLAAGAHAHAWPSRRRARRMTRGNG